MSAVGARVAADVAAYIQHLKSRRSYSAKEEEATQLTAEQRTLIRRYIINAIENPARRRVRASNANFQSLLASPSGAALLHLAGWTHHQSSDDEPFFAADSVEALQAALPAVDAAAGKALMALPDEVLCSILALLDIGSLCTMRRVSQAAQVAATRGCLWLPFCRYEDWGAFWSLLIASDRVWSLLIASDRF